jgi:hypothetical protein
MTTGVSQLQANPDGTITGRNDCWEARLASYLKDPVPPSPNSTAPTNSRHSGQ